MLKHALMATAVTFAAMSVQAQTVLISEGFENVAGLAAAGWVFQNASTPAAAGNTDWFQGDNTSAFAAQSGPSNSYIASNYLAAPAGGFIDNFLYTPTISLEAAVTLTFWARGSGGGFSDSFAVFGCTTANCSSFTQVVGDTVAVDGWTQYTALLGAQGAGSTGRFAFEYFGQADTSNYFGIDTVNVTAVPEPETYALMGLGLVALVLVRRRRSAS